MTKYTSPTMVFVGGSRVRPGKEFEVPDDAKPAPGWVKVGDGKAKAKPPAEMADTKPKDAQAAVKAKTGATNEASGLV